MASTTRLVLRRDAAKLLGCLLATGTMTGGSATTIVHTGDGGLRDSGASSDLFTGAYVLLTSGGDSGQWRMVGQTGYDPATGTLTVGEPWPTGGANGTTYQVLVGLDPGQWNDVLNDALARLRYRYRSPLTLVTDGDMETSGVANWTPTNCTRVKITSGDFINGAQALEVTNTAANGYVQTASIPCNPGDSFLAWANYRATAGTARLRAWDVTNGTSLAVDTGTDLGLNNEGGMISLAFTGASTTRNVALRHIGDEASAVIDWDDVIVMRAGRRRYTLPSWIVDRDMFAELHTRNGVRPFEYEFANTGWPVDIEEDQTAVNIFRIVIPPRSGNRPLFLVGEQSYPALASDTATTNCPLELAKYAVASEALERMGKTWERISEAGMAVDKAEIGRRLAQMQRRLVPREGRPIGQKLNWVATA